MIHTQIRAVIVGGVFDGLHLGHVKLIRHALNMAVAFGAQPVGATANYRVPAAIALINSDVSLKALDRPTRHTEQQRIEMLMTAFPQMTVRTFNETTPNAAIGKLVTEYQGQAIFIKGSDYVLNGQAPPEFGMPNVLYSYYPIEKNDGKKLGTRAEV